MGKFSWTMLFVSLLAFSFSSCNNTISKTEFNDADTITFNKTMLLDSINENNDKNRTYSISCRINVDVPAQKHLRNIFCKKILSINSDSISDKEVVAQYLVSQFNEFGVIDDGEFDDNTIQENNECDREKYHDFLIEISITPKYNKNGIITFKREEKTIRNNKLTMVSTTFVSFNSISGEPIYINNIFNESDINEITQLLKDQLKRQLNVADENALYDLGYFNLDNVEANNNFEITDQGIAWTYLPYEIACFSIGETKIILPYSFISQYINDKSILSQFK